MMIGIRREDLVVLSVWGVLGTAVSRREVIMRRGMLICRRRRRDEVRRHHWSGDNLPGHTTQSSIIQWRRSHRARTARRSRSPRGPSTPPPARHRALLILLALLRRAHSLSWNGIPFVINSLLVGGAAFWRGRSGGCWGCHKGYLWLGCDLVRLQARNR